MQWGYQSKHPAFLWERPFPFTLESVSSPSCSKFFPSITNVWHFSWALQDHGHKACSWVDHGALGLPRRHQKCGPGLLPGLPFLPSPPSASWLTAWSDQAQWETQSPRAWWHLCWKLLLSVAEGTPIRLNSIPAFCSTWANWYSSLCW